MARRLLLFAAMIGPALAILRLTAVGLLAFGAATLAHSSTLITNVRLVDGTGAVSRPASIRIEKDRIVAVGAVKQLLADEVVDGGGLTLAPGFIDSHSHHDRGLSNEPDALAVVSQGVTTVVVGQDGESDHPLSGFFAMLEKSPAAVNVASYVGHGTVRSAVMGKDFRRLATADEILKMRKLVDVDMRAGALGLSSGLEYDPGIYSNTAELVVLTQLVAKYGGRYISHIRSEDFALWQALDEIIEIGRITGVPVQVSHMKLAMVDWWGQAARFIAVMDRARAAGVDVTGDVYPYEYWHSDLTVLFPKRDFTNRAAADFTLQHVSPADGLRLSEFTPEPALVGKTVAEIAAARGTDAAQTLMDLIAESNVPGASESVMGTSMRADDIAALIAWPEANICSDGTLHGGHPRGAGAFTRVLRQYVREQKLLTLEEAVRKMTNASAAHLGIADRGTVRVGAYADLVLFDPATVADRSTVEEPHALSAGIAKVWVNGQLVFDAGHATGAHPGRVLRRQSKR